MSAAPVMSHGRQGDWMQTYTGRPFWPLDPRPEDVYPADIAHALSMICRFGGHSKVMYSVAEHCLIMSRIVTPEHALWALLHDATEAYVGDMVRPLKLAMPEYKAVEVKIMAAICDRFGLPHDCPPEIKDIDLGILRDERAALMARPQLPWSADEAAAAPLGVAIYAYSSSTIEAMYVKRLAELTCHCDGRYAGCEHAKPCLHPSGGHRSPYFCAACDPRRIEHITRNLEEFAGRLSQ